MDNSRLQEANELIERFDDLVTHYLSNNDTHGSEKHLRNILKRKVHDWNKLLNEQTTYVVGEKSFERNKVIRHKDGFPRRKFV